MNGSVKIIQRFDDFSDPDMPYMYHCHILSHEDNGMMGQFLVTNPASGTTETMDRPLLFYPNPAGETVFFEAAEAGFANAFCQVVDAGGQLVLEQTVPFANGRGSFETRGLPKGVYTAQIRFGEKKYSGIFVKQ